MGTDCTNHLKYGWAVMLTEIPPRHMFPQFGIATDTRLFRVLFAFFAAYVLAFKGDIVATSMSRG